MAIGLFTQLFTQRWSRTIVLKG